MSFLNMLKINNVRAVNLNFGCRHSLVPVVARNGAVGSEFGVPEKTPASA